MDIQIISDIHVDQHADLGEEFFETLPIAGEVLVMAGDIVSFDHYEVLASRYKAVIHVLGNHEYWGWNVSPNDVGKKFKSFAKHFDNVHVLLNETVTIENQRFIGGTLWYPEPVGFDYYLTRSWPDYKHIKSFTPWVYEQNKDFISLLSLKCKEDDVVISHHAPSELSVHRKWVNNQFNIFYVNCLEELIFEKQPKLWIHGHMHDPFDYVLDKTRVVCNPFGNAREWASTKFNPMFHVGV